MKKLDNFLKRLPESYRDANLVFAYYAAFPAVFSPDMLHQIWLFFQDYEQNNEIKKLPIVVISDLLQASFCQEVAFELFEMDEEVAAYLRSEMPKICQEKQLKLLYTPKDLASMTLEYAQQYYKNSTREHLYDFYYWKSLYLINPQQANQEIKNILKNPPQDQRTARIYWQLAELQAQKRGILGEDINKLPTFSYQQLIDSIHIEDKDLAQSIAEKLALESEINPQEDIKDTTEIIEILNNLNVGLQERPLYKVESFLNCYAVSENNNVVGLNIYGHKIDSLSFLKNLPHLEILCLDNTQIADISPIENLTKLKILNFNKNQIVDISPLKTLVNLQRIDLGENQITDISPLENLVNLHTLRLTHNQIRDISPLQTLKKLVKVKLNGNSVHNHEKIFGIESLEELDLGTTQLESILIEKELPNLRVLYLGFNQINFFPNHILKLLPNITFLELKSNPIENLPKEVFDFDLNCLEGVREYLQQKATEKPIIFLAFANDRVDYAWYLRNLNFELQEVRKTLQIAEKNGYCELVEHSNTSIDSILDVFRENQIAVFHFGGYSSSEEFIFSNSHIKNEILIDFLYTYPIKLVFLNAENSAPIAEKLLEKGISAIGINGRVQDEVAAQFASIFYENLVQGKTLEQAFSETKNALPSIQEEDETYNNYQLFATEEGKNWRLVHLSEHEQKIKALEEKKAIEYQRLIDLQKQLIENKAKITQYLKPLFVLQNTSFTQKIKGFLGIDKSYWKALENYDKALTAKDIEKQLKNYFVPENYTWSLGNNQNVLLEIAKFNNITSDKIKSLDLQTILKKHFLGHNQKHLFVLGESGVGKTTFLQKTFVDYAQTNPPYDLAFVYASEHTLAQIESIQNPQNTILFIDALDEDRAFRQDTEAQKKAFQELFREKQFFQIIFSCRTQFFENQKQEFIHILSDTNHRAVAFRLELKGFTDIQVREFSFKNFPNKHAKIMKLVKNDIKKDEVKDIFKNPFLLNHIENIIDQIQGNEIEFELYTLLIDYWVKEEATLAQKDADTYKQVIAAFSEDLALHLYQNKNQRLDKTELYQKAETWNLGKVEARTNSFLKRSQDNIYAFAHQSIYEYFLAVLWYKQKIDSFKDFPELAQLFCTQKRYLDAKKNRKYEYEKKAFENGYFIENQDLEGVLEVMFRDKTILAEHQNYKVLIFNNCQLQSLVFATSLRKIEQLSLLNNQIQDILPLKDLINLQGLELQKNRIENIEVLENLKNLQVLFLYDNPINDSDIKKLQEALPKCRIIFTKAQAQEFYDEQAEN